MKTAISIFFAAAFLIMASAPPPVGAYGGPTHEWVVIQGFDLFKCPGPEPCTCQQHYYPELEETNWINDILVALGSEDGHNHVGWDLPIDNTVSHFWDGDDGNELATNDFMGGIVYDIPNALDNARRLVKQARELYLSNQKTGDAGAYDLLSHAIHLIADMTVPAHAHVVDHGLLGDSYDDWCGYPEDEENTYAKNHAGWTADHARAAGGPVVIPDDAGTVYTQILQDYSDGHWPPLSPGADLYYLIYTANQYGDYFGSQGGAIGNGADGDDNERRSWVNYSAFPFSSLDDPPRTEDRLIDNSEVLTCIAPTLTCPVCMMVNATCWVPWGSVNDDDGDLSKIASVNLVYAYRAAATMIKSFRDSIDNIPPVSAINLEGTAGHNGWFRSDVYMKLSATDNSDGMVWAPNRTMSQWREAASQGCWIDYVDPQAFTSEGIKEIKYRSIDGLGNEEGPLAAAVKIDKTNPVISITSPDKDGFYLTTGTLQIVFNVSDPISGVYSQVAKLDGNVVSNLQVFDLSAMGGWHTFTVEAEDYAGNKISNSVTFSIKISATITVNPVKINVKSSSDPVTVYIEFPAGYDVGQIDVPETSLNPHVGWFLMASPSPTEVKDADHDKVPDRMVKFNRQDFITAVQSATGNTNVVVQGELIDKTEFYGTGTVLVTNPGK